MIQRIIKVGNSLVVTLSKVAIESLQLIEGDEVNLTVDPGQNRILIQPVGHSTELEEVNQEFADQVSEFISQYKPALDELARLKK